MEKTILEELDRLRKRIGEMQEENEMLRSELAVYDTDRKTDLLEGMNEFEKELIYFLEEMQDDYCYDDCELVRYKMCEYDVIIEQFLERITQKLDEKKIKQYFQYERYHA